MLKKTMAALTASALILTGCASAEVKTDKAKVNTESLYQRMDDDSYLFAYMLKKLKNKQSPVTDDMKFQSEETLKNLKANYKQQYNSTADQELKNYYKQYGIKNDEDFKKTIVNQLQDQEFVRKYVRKNFNAVAEDYYKKMTPKKISVIETDKKSVKKAMKEASLSDKSFIDAASKYSSDTDTADSGGDIGIVDSGSNSVSSKYGQKAQKAIMKMNKGDIKKFSYNSKIYIVKCTASSFEDIKKELQPVYITSPILSYDTYADVKAYKDAHVKYTDKKTESRVNKYIESQLKEAKNSATGTQS